MVKIPSNLKLVYSKRNSLLVLKGPFGKIKINISDELEIKQDILVLNGKLSKFHFLFKSLFDDLSFGFDRFLELKGIGYQVFLNSLKNTLIFKLGYSHQIHLPIPKEIWVRVKNKRILSIKSFNRIHVLSFVSKIRKLRKRNKYKEKGIFFIGERYILKSGKQVS